MRFPYHDAYDAQFEVLTVEICHELLGDGIQSFSAGPDGGRDARFQGTAVKFPNSAHPHSGTFIVQAKHTENPVAKFSDPDFSGTAASSTLSKEMPRIKALVDACECDHYMLFSNRRLAGNADADIRGRIIDETGVTTVALFGVEGIDSALKRHPKAMDLAGLSELRMPLRVTPDDLAAIIVALAGQRAAFGDSLDDTVIDRTSFEEKNKVNNMGKDLAAEITKTYMREFSLVGRFLGHPDNAFIMERYLEAVAEFNEQILDHVDGSTSFGKVLLNLQRLLWDRDGDLRSNKRLTKLVLYYMYWMCDLGKTPNNVKAN